jgi:phosphoribosyl 1,2-cyclic phosphodiesterase
VQSERTRLLVDAGRLGRKYIEAQLDSLDVSLDEINGIVATHVHGDHVDAGTTAQLCRRFDIPLYVHYDTYPDLLRRSDKFAALSKAGLVRQFDCAPFAVGDLTVTPFPVTHGGEFGNDMVGRPVGFAILHHDGARTVRIGYSTDLGHTDEAIEAALSYSDALVLECNHDVEAEQRSRRPYHLVRWVLGPRGHLSNDQCGEALRRILSAGNGRTQNVILAHLSQECNTPELALDTVRRHLAQIDAADTPLHVAPQSEKSTIIEL